MALFLPEASTSIRHLFACSFRKYVQDNLCVYGAVVGYQEVFITLDGGTPTRTQMVGYVKEVADFMGLDMATFRAGEHVFRVTAARFLREHLHLDTTLIMSFCRWGSAIVLRYLVGSPRDVGLNMDPTGTVVHNRCVGIIDGHIPQNRKSVV